MKSNDQARDFLYVHGPATQAEIAEHVQLSQSATSRMLQSTEFVSIALPGTLYNVRNAKAPHSLQTLLHLAQWRIARMVRAYDQHANKSGRESADSTFTPLLEIELLKLSRALGEVTTNEQ